MHFLDLQNCTHLGPLAEGYGIVFDAQFINNCTLTQFTYALKQSSLKHELMSTISSCNKVQFSASVFEDQRLKRTDLAVVHDSSPIGTGPSVALFQKLEDGGSSDKILSWRAAIKRVTWQLLSKFLCLLSARVTRWS